MDDALLSIGFGKFQALVLCYAGMGWISEAMEMMLLSFVGPAVQVEWNLSPQQESFITSVVFAGMLLGAYSWGIISDIHGRRQVLSFEATHLIQVTFRLHFYRQLFASLSFILFPCKLNGHVIF